MIKIIKYAAIRFYLIIIIFLLLGAVTGVLQAQTNGSLKGTVIDKSNGKPVEEADVTINRVKDSSLVKGTQTDASGNFIISGIPNGNYYIKVSLVGYTPAYFSNININPANQTVSLEPIKLSTGNTTTEEIVVEGEKSTIEFKPDKKVFNISKSITNQGNSVIDLLKEIPSVTVDQDNNISLRGSEGVKILLDGRSSGLDGTNRGDLLEQIPASQVESIELITNPSAKYEAEGSSGIINIILKKSKDQGLGYNGTLGLNLGTGDKYNGQLSLSLKNKKYNLYGNYAYRLFHMTMSGSSQNYNFLNSDQYFTNELSDGRGRMEGHTAKFGIDINLNQQSLLGFSVNYRNNNRGRFNTLNDNIFSSGNILTSQYYNTTISDDKGYDFDLNGNYTLKMPNNRIFTADLSFSRDKDNDESNTFDTYVFPNILNPQNRNEYSDELNDSYIADLNYTHPITKNIKIETGYRGSYKKNDNNYQVDTLNYSTNQYETDLGSSNRFIYKEQIHALYGIYTQQLGNFGFSLGVRAEETIIKGDLLNTGQNFDRSYIDFFPSASISQKFGMGSEIQLSYSRRLNRPSLWQLNPFRTISFTGGTNNYREGNPNLNPELTDAFELSYIHYFPFATVTPSIFYRETKDQISRQRTYIDSVNTLSTFVNYNKSKFYGGELIVNATPLKIWTLNGTFSYYKSEIDASNLGQANSGYSWTARATSTLMLPADLSLQISYFYSGRNYNAQGYFEPFSMLDAAVKKDFFYKRLSVSLRVSDILNEAKFKASISGIGYQDTFERKRDARNLFLNISYRFGQQEKNKMVKNRNNENNDNNNNGDGQMDY
ncbi:MAG: TonB-dependent receptor [Ignavibacteria bacterium]|nr:TonB-dependent receptor [Ignavibacteria bacterium]